MKAIRKIVHIDEDKCNGCGLCVPACHEGAIQIIDGKARLLEDHLCDGLGDCLGECPLDAIRIEEREADPFDEEAVKQHLEKKRASKEDTEVTVRRNEEYKIPCGCPGAQLRNSTRDDEPVETREEVKGEIASELNQWPVQLGLIPPHAPFFKEEKILVAADCVPFAYADFHRKILKGKPVVIGCPKLDDGMAYVEKFTAILDQNDIKEITIAHMEVPCCSGLIQILRRAVEQSGKDTVLRTIKISIDGKIMTGT